MVREAGNSMQTSEENSLNLGALKQELQGKPTISKSLRSVLLTSAMMLPFMGAHAVFAQDATEEFEEIVIIADPVGLLEDRPTDSVFGLKRSILDTPRSLSVVSDQTMERYSIEDIDDLITTTPGTFGGSFFGIPGSVSVRGTRAENFFRGFKRAVNNGFFPTPIGASAQIEVIRGPVPAIFGAGRIGGLLNTQPKTVRGEGMSSEDGPSGNISYTGGSYSKNNVTAEVNLPFLMAGRETGVSVYAEYEDSKSFYRNRTPEHKLIQLGFNHDLSDTMRIAFGGMYFKSEGYYQTPGWNRLTQELIDDGTYITGRDTDMGDTDGNGRLTPNEIDAAVGTFFGTSNIRTLIDFGFFGVPGAYGLDEGVGTTQLSTRDVFLSENDEIQNGENITVYFDLIKDIGDSELKLQFFYDEIDAQIGLTTGFAAEHLVDTFETRLSYDYKWEVSNDLQVDLYATASYRSYNSELRENFLSGYLILDRRDLSVGATGNDILDTPFTDEAGGIGIGWDSNFDSRYEDTGVALVADIKIMERFSILLNGRYDDYSARSIDTGATVFDPTLANTEFTSSEDDFSFSASASYNFPIGIVPYITYAEGSNILENSNGGVSPGVVRTGSILADSELLEIGIKFGLMDGALNGSIAYYDQKRSVIDDFGNIDGEQGEGLEIELRYLIDEHWTLTGAATFQEYNINAPGVCFSGRGEFVNLPPSFLGLDPAEGYGGIFAALNASCVPELQEGYQEFTIPETVISSFITYTSDQDKDIVFGGTFGGTYVSETGGKIANAIVLPSYTTFRAAAFVEKGRYSLTATMENVFDKRYFQPITGVFAEVAALPGRGREFRITGKVKF